MFQGNRNIISTTIILTLLILCPAISNAGSTSIQQEKLKYRQIKEDLQEKKRLLEAADKVENVTLSSIHRANRKLQKVKTSLRRYRSKLNKTRLNMERAKLEIKDLEADISESRAWLRGKLAAMQRQGAGIDTDKLLALATAADLASLTRRSRYLEVLSMQESTRLKHFKESLNKLQSKRKKLDKIYTRYNKEQRKVQKTQKNLKREKKSKELLLNTVRKEKDTYKRLIRELRKASARMQKIIRNSERTKATRFRGTGFRNLKGKLEWPVKGKVAIPYGSHKDPKFDTPVFRNGIYFSSSADAVAEAVHGGKVVFADWFEGYGQLVIVNHGKGYHTLYGNLSEIFLRIGDIINKDDEIGRVGTSGTLQEPALYFEIRYKGKPLNPAHWLTKK